MREGIITFTTSGNMYEAGLLKKQWIVQLHAVSWIPVVAMLKAVDRIAEDVPLCSFDRVIRAYEEEIEEGHIRKIYDLEFGYVFYDDPKYVSGEGFAEHYYAVPAWRLNCLYMSNRQKELPRYNTEESTEERDSLEYAALVVNAQTGEMLNFMSKDKNRAHYKGSISWNDVQ